MSRPRVHPHRIGLALLAILTILSLRSILSWAQEPTQEELELGARLYAENCAVCHGPDGKGRVGVTLAKDWPSIRPGLRVREAIENGIPGSPMPAWSQKKGGPLTDEEIDALVRYILSWETGGIPPLAPTPTFTPRPPITPIPEVAGDPNRGAILYAENCAVCHGPSGEGRVGATLARAWPSIRPDLRVKTVIEEGVPGSPMPAWSRENGGPLTEQDIDDIVAFILSWQPLTPSEAPAAPTLAIGPGQHIEVIAILIASILIIAGGVMWYSRR
ncbi:MAG TPA: c-type cytochrome [Caldilineae bacterium]|nr:c-type cytochrome [Caldilineae bacterium]